MLAYRKIQELKYYHAFNLISFLGPLRQRKIFQHFGSPSRAWKASVGEFFQIEGFTQSFSEQIARARDKINPVESWEELVKKDISILTIEDPDYPELLKEIYDPPLLIYYQGDVGALNTKSLAIVGSRRHTLYGKEIARKFAAQLCGFDVIIVSGMARGIDTWAHEGALEAGGKTVAVLGCGLDICYPPENRDLKERIREKGIIISEFPPGTSPMAQNFPRRNRIISGLSLGTLVVEAGEKSGALITAEFALEQGREVFAIPGSVSSPYSKGCHRLIKEGAKLVEKVEDILEELPFLPEKKDKLFYQQQSIFKGNPGHQGQHQICQDEKILLENIPYEPVSLEDIIQLSQMPPSKVNFLLLELELKGIIKQLPGKYFRRI